MRIFPMIISVVICVSLIICLDSQWGSLPPIGKFLSPQHGFWQNAEAVGNNLNAEIQLPQIKDKGEVYFDDRLVPHIFTNNEEDAYFIQGYLHAKFRLWQMEFQVLAAGGRLSEILGPGEGNVYLNHDREILPDFVIDHCLHFCHLIIGHLCKMGEIKPQVQLIYKGTFLRNMRSQNFP